MDGQGEKLTPSSAFNELIHQYQRNKKAGKKRGKRRRKKLLIMIQSGTVLAMEIETIFVGFKLEHLVGTILRKAPINVVTNNTKLDHFQYKNDSEQPLRIHFLWGKGPGGSCVSCFKY